MKRHLLGHADEPSSSHHGNVSQLDHADWKDVFEPQSCAAPPNDAEAPNLDWFDALITTARPVSSQLSSHIQDPLFIAGELSSTAMFSPTTQLDSTVVMQSRPAGSTVSNGNTPQYFSDSLRYSDRSKDLKLPPELFNSMVDDYARKWLRDLCNK